MNWIDSHSRFDEGVTVGSCKINRLLFVDNFMLLESSQRRLQYPLDRFSSLSTLCPATCLTLEQDQVLQ